MKFIFSILIYEILICFSVNGQSVIYKLPVWSYQELEARINEPNDTLYVYNFWATWCKPCVEELPYFEQVHEEFKGSAVKIILVSLDFKSQLQKRLIPFVEAKKLKSKVVLLDEPNYNLWIDKIDPKWSGSIPATLVVNSKNNLRQFYEKSFTLSELQLLIHQHFIQTPK